MSWKEKVGNIRDGMWVASLISIPLTFIMTLVVVGAWSIYGTALIEAARIELGIDRNYELILKALGEDRVIRQPDNLSYVQEPVIVGERIIVNLVIERTDYGANCVFTGGNTIFIQPDGISIAGNKITPTRQIGTDLTRIQIAVDPPLDSFVQRNELNKRWAIYFGLDYDCPGGKVIEETNPIPFIMKSK